MFMVVKDWCFGFFKQSPVDSPLVGFFVIFHAFYARPRCGSYIWDV